MLRVSVSVLTTALMVSLAVTAGCSSSADPTPTPVPATMIPTFTSTVAIEYTATNTPLPNHTSTPVSTDAPVTTPAPARIATAANTPIPTPAVVPTHTPLPTSTQTPTPVPTDTPTAVPTATHTPLPFDTLKDIPIFNPGTLPSITWQFGDELPQDHKNAAILAAKTMYDYALAVAEPSVEEIVIYAYRNLDDLIVAYADFWDYGDKEAFIDGYKEDWSGWGGLMVRFDFVDLDSGDGQIAKKAAVFLRLDADINWTIENTAHELSHALRSSPGTGRIE